MIRVAVVCDAHKNHHSSRLMLGLRACNIEVVIDHKGVSTTKYDYVFVESSFPKEITYETDSNIILYDVEDDPRHEKLGEAFYQLKDKALAYVKYNYIEDTFHNLKVIGSPLVEYMYRGSDIAKKIVGNQIGEPSLDAFFIGGPSYYSLGYKASPNANHVDREELCTTPKSLIPDHKGRTVYHQRLEWVDKLSRNDQVKFQGGLWFQDLNNISEEFQVKQFGKGVLTYKVNKIAPDSLYTFIFNSLFGLCPSGFARSSFRLIELMALAKPLLLTSGLKYSYLYNPISFHTIEDGEDIDTTILELKDDQEKLNTLKEGALANHKIFMELTPEKMWQDFVSKL